MKHTIGVLGLGVMGSSIALNMASKGEKVAVYNYTRNLTDQLMAKPTSKGLTPYYSVEDFVQSLQAPRKIFLMVTAGEVVDNVIKMLMPYLEKGDMIMDGGNSFYKDTARRYEALKPIGINFLGLGISGGEEGALKGPSIMPGGDQSVYEEVAPILTKIAAQVDGEPCCVYMGPKGAGHFVKTVHNGIEYADMQLIAEVYTFLRERLAIPIEEIASIFETWNKGELKSYLIEITANILKKKDDETGLPLVDVILDKAAQNGTGKWTSIEAIDNGVPVSMITESLFARYLSHMKEERVQASTVLKGPEPSQTVLDRDEWVEYVKQALYMGKICAYAQGFTQYKVTSEKEGWQLPLKDIALIFRGGCIIRAAFLNKISQAYEEEASIKNLLLAPYFVDKTSTYQLSLRKVIAESALCGLAFPSLTASLTYYDSYRTAQSNANLLQAQRDYFGTHTYERVDKKGSFHTNWV